LLFSANSAIWQLYHGENKLHFCNFQRNDDEARFVLDQHALLGFYCASLLQQQSEDRHVAPLGHIILIPSQPVLLLNVVCLGEKQQIPI
jgi:hypothetical protein